MDVQLSTRIGTNAYIPWEGHMNLGDGFDANDMQSAKSPFIEVEVQPLEALPSYRKVDFQQQFIKDNADFRKAIKLAVDVSASVQHLAASSSVKLLKDVECNSTHVATFVRCTITAPQQLYSSEPQLTEPAMDQLSRHGTEEFARRYGSHFVAGQLCQSAFTVILTHSTASSEGMAQLIQILSPIYTMLGDFTSLTKLTEILKKSHVDTRVRLAMTGSTFKDIKAFPTLDDIVPIFDAWKCALQPEPYIAILKHYSLVIDEIPRPRSRWDIHTDLVEAYEDLLLLHMKTRSAHKVEVLQFLIDSIEKLERRLMKIEVSDSHWKNDLKEWRKEYGQKEVEFDKFYRPIERRRELLQVVCNSQKNGSWPKNRKMYPGQITEFRTGITTPELFEELSSEVAVFKWWFSKDREPHTNGIVQKEVCEFGLHGDRIVIGIEAISDREDHHNNGWFTLRKGGVGEIYVNMFFETSHWRASEWSVQIWHVDKKLFLPSQAL